MLQQKLTKELEYKHKEITFKIRAQATRGDQYYMGAELSDTAEFKDSKAIKVKVSALYPWLIDRFVIDWEGVQDDTGKKIPWSLDALLDLPSEPGEDLVLILGAYIFNHTGLSLTKDAEGKKKADSVH